MTHASDALNELYRDLQKTKAPLERLRLISQGWRVIRNLNPQERNSLAARLGIEGAEEVVERLAQRENSRVPLALLDALRHLKHANTGEMRWLIRRLREADERHELLVDGSGKAAEALDAKEAEAAHPPTPDAPPSHDFEITPSPPIPAFGTSMPRASTPAAPIATPHTPAPVAAPEPSVTPPQALEPPVPSAPILPGTPKPITQRIEALAEKAPPKPAAPIAALEEKSAIAAEATPAQPAVETSPALTLDSLLADLRARSSDLSRTRRILSALSSLTITSTDEWKQIIETHTGGWSRRRALIALIDKGFVVNREQALPLIGALDAEWDRFQCLLVLAQHGVLTKSDVAAPALVESDHLRKRLQRLAPPDRQA